MPWEQSVIFPSQINQVNFAAEQVTPEMQGVNVKGMMIWSVHRLDEGPFKCYKSFGAGMK